MSKPPRSSDEIRTAFLSFFQERGHEVLAPWPLVPIGDPTSLFTTAGMQQFKPVFAGEQERPARRVTTVQRCFRTTDIEEVGDGTHLTCFEMLGNFSFGDYFKREAIEWAWALLTGVYCIPPERLHITVFLTDDEAYNCWRDLGVQASHIHRRGEDLNYWFSFPRDVPGGSGPCGPDSEIYYDYFPERGTKSAEAGVGYDDERFVEIWNLVFMELYQHPDGNRTRLPAQNIDTGSGLERVAAALQGVRSVYDTDIFQPILEEAARIAKVGAISEASAAQAHALRAMAEHCRAAALLIADGVVPSNEGRGYVLRRIVRRAIYMGRTIGVAQPFTARLANAAINRLKTGYPQLEASQEFVRRALDTEEGRFLRTLAAGTQRLDAMLEEPGTAVAKVLSGGGAFLLHDTYGMPLELTREVAAKRGFTIDEAGFAAALEGQRRRAREHGRVLAGEPSKAFRALGDEHSNFVGYASLESEGHIAGILKGGALSEIAVAGESCQVVLSATPFYPEGGGQVGDKGTLVSTSGVFEVEDTQTTGGAIVHSGRMREGELHVGEPVQASVDVVRRHGAARNHTGTHILHAALRSILGKHVRQQGSLVTPGRLRFDFTHLEQTPRTALMEIERLANEKVRHDLEVSWRTTGYRQAVEGGALAFFGDKYGSEVRIVEIRDDSDLFSAELCGGTHVHHTGEIGLIHIVRESAVAAGTRRIEAFTGQAAEEHLLEQQTRLYRLAEQLGTGLSEIEDRVAVLQAELQTLRQQNEELRRARSAAVAEGLAAGATLESGIHLVAARVEAESSQFLREVADRIRERLRPSVVILASAIDGRGAFLVAGTSDVVERGFDSGELIRRMAAVAGGQGGGRRDIAQAGARDVSRLEAALAEGRRLAATVIAATGV